MHGITEIAKKNLLSLRYIYETPVGLGHELLSSPPASSESQSTLDPASPAICGVRHSTPDKSKQICFLRSLIHFVHEPPVGLEPTTDGLQNRCSTNWAKVAYAAYCSRKDSIKKRAGRQLISHCYLCAYWFFRTVQMLYIWRRRLYPEELLTPNSLDNTMCKANNEKPHSSYSSINEIFNCNKNYLSYPAPEFYCPVKMWIP